MLDDLFDTIDSMDAEGFSAFITDNCSFRFGNLPTVQGKENITGFVQQFFESLHAVNHEIRQSWKTEDGIVCHGMVTYIRHDQFSLTVPFCNVVSIREEGIYEYLIFADTSLLYA